MRTILLTGSTGHLGTHILSALLSYSPDIRVRGTTRSGEKARVLRESCERWVREGRLEVVVLRDFGAGTESEEEGGKEGGGKGGGKVGEDEVGFEEVMEGVEGVVHSASPFTYTTTNPTHDLILPALNGIRSLLRAISLPTSTVRRLVLTSSFASVVDIAAFHPPSFTYTGEHWNPLTYAEAVEPNAGAVVAYRASKKFAELEAWEWVRAERREWDLVTLCPPMLFGPLSPSHTLTSPHSLSESAKTLWNVAAGATPLPEARVPVWIDVRDLAKMHVEALFRPEVGGKRYVPCAEERYSFELARWIVQRRFAGGDVPVARAQRSGAGKKDGGNDEEEEEEEEEEEMPVPKESYELDWRTVERELGVKGRGFEESVVDFVEQMFEMFPEEMREGLVLR